MWERCSRDRRILLLYFCGIFQPGQCYGENKIQSHNTRLTEAGLREASLKDDSLIPTAVKNGDRIAKDLGISGNKKVKIECTTSKEVQPNDFQPAGTASSRDRTNYNTISYKESTSGMPNKNHETLTAGDCTPDSSMKKTIETRKFILPELVESGDETDSTSESGQEYRIGRANHQPHEANVTSEKAILGVPQPSGKVVYEDLWLRSVTKRMDTESCMNNTEMMSTDNPNVNEKIEFKSGRKPKEAIEGDLIRFMHNDLTTTRFPGYKADWSSE